MPNFSQVGVHAASWTAQLACWRVGLYADWLPSGPPLVSTAAHSSLSSDTQPKWSGRLGLSVLSLARPTGSRWSGTRREVTARIELSAAYLRPSSFRKVKVADFFRCVCCVWDAALSVRHCPRPPGEEAV